MKVRFTVPGDWQHPPMELVAVEGRPDNPEAGQLWHDRESIYMFSGSADVVLGPVEKEMLEDSGE